MIDPQPGNPPRTRTAGSLHRHGGLLCLDFINTATWHGGTVLREHLVDFEDVLQWGVYCQVADIEPVRHLMQARGVSPGPSADELAIVQRLRQGLRRLLTTPTSEHRGDGWQRDADDLCAMLRSTIARSRLNGPTLPLTWQAPSDVTSWLIGPVALSAASLLTGPEILRVRQCEGEGCGWLFLDRSRSHQRRWCAMEPCGNRIKARAHAGRRRQQGAGNRGRPS